MKMLGKHRVKLQYETSFVYDNEELEDIFQSFLQQSIEEGRTLEGPDDKRWKSETEKIWFIRQFILRRFESFMRESWNEHVEIGLY